MVGPPDRPPLSDIATGQERSIATAPQNADNRRHFDFKGKGYCQGRTPANQPVSNLQEKLGGRGEFDMYIFMETLLQKHFLVKKNIKTAYNTLVNLAKMLYYVLIIEFYDMIDLLGSVSGHRCPPDCKPCPNACTGEFIFFFAKPQAAVSVDN